MKFALEIRTRKIKDNKLLSWFCTYYDSEEKLNEDLKLLHTLQDINKSNLLTEIEYIHF